MHRFVLMVDLTSAVANNGNQQKDDPWKFPSRNCQSQSDISLIPIIIIIHKRNGWNFLLNSYFNTYSVLHLNLLDLRVKNNISNLIKKLLKIRSWIYRPIPPSAKFQIRLGWSFKLCVRPEPEILAMQYPTCYRPIVEQTHTCAYTS